VQPIATSEGQEIPSEWTKKSFCANCLIDAWNRQDLTEEERQDMEVISDYWMEEFPSLAEKTRSIVVSSFTGFADVFLRGTLRKLFSTSTNIIPEVTHEGALVLVDLPVHEYGKVGQYSQAIIKYLWQKATERRQGGDNVRPVFLWADEAQFFINQQDVQFQTTARSAKACTVYITQNLPNYISSLGKDLTYSLLGNLQTKIFHQNGDTETNQYASNLMGQEWKQKLSTSLNTSRQADIETGQNAGSSVTKELQPNLLPVELTRLAKGGEENNFLVEGVIFQGGRIYEVNHQNYIKLSFPQKE
jgi:type IV secretory pathway TraG/TraD family ATPase VirD4